MIKFQQQIYRLQESMVFEHKLSFGIPSWEFEVDRSAV